MAKKYICDKCGRTFDASSFTYSEIEGKCLCKECSDLYDLMKAFNPNSTLDDFNYVPNEDN